MDFSRALDQIAEIHEHLSRSEVYRGLRSFPVALSGFCGLLGAVCQPWFDLTPQGSVLYWLAVAAASGCVGMSEVTVNYIRQVDPFEKSNTRRIILQFGPSIFAGFAITLALTFRDASFIPVLPGLWALFFGLGAFAARPYLPRASGWVGLFYFATGIVLLLDKPESAAVEAWRVGIPFGVGQLLAAFVLHWNLERKPHETKERSRPTRTLFL